MKTLRVEGLSEEQISMLHRIKKESGVCIKDVVAKGLELVFESDYKELMKSENSEVRSTEVQGYPSDVYEALKLEIITEQELKFVLERMEERDIKRVNEIRKRFGLPPK